MIKTIGKITYDTQTASIVKKNTFGDYGCPKGYEETLYVTESGKYFLYVNGGETSKHPTEKITALSKERANKFLSGELKI